ncbi:MAG TPA: SDR family oxidoreductase [Polyangiaceae bacterium]|nr:SDR family oxidoreductase [Polyangiaceae bacterium]
MKHTSAVALVTGANKGIGHEIARELAARGFTVLVGSRDVSRGQAAAQRIGGDARAIQLDVTDAESIAAAAARIQRELGRLDILVNNAGIARAHADGTPSSIENITREQAPSRMPLADIRAIFETNLFGTIAVTQALLPLLREAPAARIVNVSSGLGSLSRITGPDLPFARVGGIAYGPSKTALNAVTVAFAQELEGTRIKVNAVCPGFTATDLNDHSGTRTVAEAARRPVELALLGAEGPTGTLSNDAGVVGW